MPKETLFPVKKLVALPRELAAEINTFRFEHRFKTESEAIRRLIELGLERIGKGQRRPS